MVRLLARLTLLALVASPLTAQEDLTRIILPEARPAPGFTAERAELQRHLSVPVTMGIEIEPNERVVQASHLTIPMVCEGAVIWADRSAVLLEYEGGLRDGIEDLYALDAHAGNLTLELTYPNSAADLDLLLMAADSDQSLRVVAASNFQAPGRSERIEISLPPGRYYVGVSAVLGSSPYTLTSSASGFPAPCSPDATSLCLNEGRFRIQTHWQTTDGQWEKGDGVLLSLETGYVFGASGGVVVKVLHACRFNDRFWLFARGRTDVKVTMTVTDTVTGTIREYASPAGSVDWSIADTEAFATCSEQRRDVEDFLAAVPEPVQGHRIDAAADQATLAGDAAIDSAVWSFEAMAQRILRTGPDAGAPKRRTVIPPTRCSYSVAPASQTFTSSAATGTVNVTTGEGCVWTSSSSATWLTITSDRAGRGNGSLAYSVSATTSTSSRTGTLTVAGQTISITQTGAPPPCTFTVSPTTRQFTAAGGTDTISMTTRSDCAWTASVSTTATWITITAGGSGVGNGSVTYSVAAHSATTNRSGSITVGGRTVTINQSLDASSCTYTAQYTTRSLTWCGGERTVRVTTQGDCPWTASSNASWLTITLPSRSGSRDLSYVVSSNTTGSSRQATLTVAGTPVTITQNARSGGGTYDGNWTGTTNGNRPVTLCVAEGAIQNVEISVRLVFSTFSCTLPLIRQDSLAITGNTFTGTFTTYPEVSNIFTTARGAFTSASAMNGSWDAYSGSYFIICGSTVSVGTAGTILSSGTFTATKQP